MGASHSVVEDDMFKRRRYAPPEQNWIKMTSLISLPQTSSSPLIPSSTTTSVSQTKNVYGDENPVQQRLQIQTPGQALLSLPFPQSELQTPIFLVDETTQRASRPAYLSIRPSYSSGSCFLTAAEDSTQTAIARTAYRFGPSRPPMVTLNTGRGIGDEENTVVLHGTSIFRRTVTFTSARFGTFVWRYGWRREKARVARLTGLGCDNLIVLDKIDMVGNGKGKKVQRVTQVARLIRGEETRTPGTWKSTAGNGGRLEICAVEQGEGGMDADADADEEADGRREEELRVLIVATCLVMLKKEVDRMRAVKIGTILGIF